MTIREIILEVITLDEPMQCIVGSLDILRSFSQQEACTLEGLCCSYYSWLDKYKVTTKESVLQWMNDIGSLADYEIPDKFILSIINNDSDDE